MGLQFRSVETISDIYDFDVCMEASGLEILPKSGFYNNNYLIYMFIGGVIIVLLLIRLAALISIMRTGRISRDLPWLFYTDRYLQQARHEQVEQYMKAEPAKHCVMAMLDIDDFKLVSDMWTCSGDGVLKKLAEA